MTSSPIRVAVVGAMGYGRTHLRALAGLTAEAELAGTVDPRPLAGEPLELAGDAPHHASLSELLAGEVPDVVAIASPIPSHAPLAETAMRAGSHVLLEKPPTATYADYAHLLAVAEEMGRACQIGFQADGSSVYAEVERAIADGELGEIRGVGAVGTWTRARSYYERAPWAGRRRLDGVEVVDGVATNPLAHAIHAALRLAGARQAQDVASIEAELFRAHGIEADDTSAIRVLTTAGLPVAAGLTLCAPTQAPPRVIVHGTRGRAVFRYAGDELEIQGSAGTRTLTCTRTGVLANLVAHARDPRVPLVSPIAASGAFMRVLETIRTAPDPAAIGEQHVRRFTDEAGEQRVVVAGVEQWCERVGEELQTFSALGAPWAA